MKRVEILKKAFDYLVFKGVLSTRAEFADAIAFNKTNLSSAMNGNEKYLSDSLMNKIGQAFPEFNLQWLMNGEGAMLKVPAATMSPYPADEMVSQATPTEAMRDGVNVITDASGLDMSAIPAAIVEEVKEEVREEVIAEVQKAEAVPIIPSEVAKRENLDIGEWLNENESELEHFIPSQMTADVDGVERVRKTSMLPTLAPQDWVFIKLVDKSLMLDGETYYFKLRKLPTMIRMVKFEGEGKLRLIAQNPKFGDIITSVDDIINVATIEGMFRKNIANQYDEIEAVHRKKDAQIDNLIENNSKALEIAERLATVIEKKI